MSFRMSEAAGTRVKNPLLVADAVDMVKFLSAELSPG